jgi:dTDP-4-amino-4,6-dideoxygalactose transaminase
MPIFNEIPPTAGWPLRLKDFSSALKFFGEPTGLKENFRSYLGAPYARITNSGTAALYIILEAIKALSPKRTIVIPAYVCPLVALAISRAGFKVAVCDIGPDDFNFDYNQLRELCERNADIAAAVAVHLAGIPIDFNAALGLVKGQGIFIIEDCAQALGATYEGKPVGTLADFSFFSLARGKGLTIYEGGVLVVNNTAYIAAIENKINLLLKPAPFSEAVKISELFGYWIFYRRRLFWFVFSLPQIFWRLQAEDVRASSDYFSLDFPVHAVSNFREAVGRQQFFALASHIAGQRERASWYIEELRDAKGIRLITEPQPLTATYPYLTLLFDEPAKKSKALSGLGLLGLGVSQIYSQAITDYEYLKGIIPRQNCPHARSLAGRAITLSTSVFLKKEDARFMAKAIRNI